MNKKSADFLSFLNKTFPNAHCELNFHDDFSCLVAIMLSAQTTDKSVNRVTPSLWAKFPSVYELSNSTVEKIQPVISSLGMSKTKARNLLELSKIIVRDYSGIVPTEKDLLLSLPGIGIKTTNVFLAERYKVPAIPVDTHISRISIRLKYAKEGTRPSEIEKILEKNFQKEDYIPLHHKIIFFGRNICLARNPKCSECEMQKYCKDYKIYASKIDK